MTGPNPNAAKKLHEIQIPTKFGPRRSLREDFSHRISREDAQSDHSSGGACLRRLGSCSLSELRSGSKTAGTWMAGPRWSSQGACVTSTSTKSLSVAVPVTKAVTVVLPGVGVSRCTVKSTLVPSPSVAPSAWKVARSFDQR